MLFGLTDKISYRFELIRHGLNSNQPGLGIEDHGSSRLLTHQMLKSGLQILPEITVIAGFDLGTVGGGAGALGGICRIVTTAGAIGIKRAIIVLLLRHSTRGDAGPGHAIAGHHQIVDREAFGSQSGRIDMKHRVFPANIIPIHAGDCVQNLRQSDILQIQRDQTLYPGVHCHAIATTFHQGSEELRCRNLLGSDAKASFDHRG